MVVKKDYIKEYSLKEKYLPKITLKGCLLFQLLMIFISFINNLDKVGFLEYPDRYPNWCPVFSVDPVIYSSILLFASHIN